MALHVADTASPGTAWRFNSELRSLLEIRFCIELDFQIFLLAKWKFLIFVFLLSFEVFVLILLFVFNFTESLSCSST